MQTDNHIFFNHSVQGGQGSPKAQYAGPLTEGKPNLEENRISHFTVLPFSSAEGLDNQLLQLDPPNTEILQMDGWPTVEEMQEQQMVVNPHFRKPSKAA